MGLFSPGIMFKYQSEYKFIVCYYLDSKDNKLKRKPDDVLENDQEMVILDLE